MSSANPNTSMFFNLASELMSESIKHKKKLGPMQEPCKTPLVMGDLDENVSLILTSMNEPISTKSQKDPWISVPE